MPLASTTATPPIKSGPADVTLRIGPVLVDVTKDKTISTIGYNGQVPGPLIRLREDQQVSVQLFNDTDTPEFVHWHGQFIPSEVDGAGEEKSIVVPPRGRGNRWNLFVTTCANPKKFMFPTAWGIGRFERIGIIYPHLCAPFVGVVETVCGQRGGSTISTKCMFSAESSNFDPVLCRHVVSDPRLPSLSREERGKPEARTLPRRAFYADAAAHALD